MCQKITQADPSNGEHVVVAKGALVEVPSTLHAGDKAGQWSSWVLGGVYRIKSILCKCWDLRRRTMYPSAVFLAMDNAVYSLLFKAQAPLLSC